MYDGVIVFAPALLTQLTKSAKSYTSPFFFICFSTLAWQLYALRNVWTASMYLRWWYLQRFSLWSQCHWELCRGSNSYFALHSCPCSKLSGGFRGCNRCICYPLQKFQKISFCPFIKVFGPLQCVCVCYTTENTLVTCTMWAWDPTNPFKVRSLHKNTHLHLLWHFKVTRIEISSGRVRVILPMHVRGQIYILCFY